MLGDMHYLVGILREVRAARWEYGIGPIDSTAVVITIPPPMGIKETYFKNISHTCDFISVISVILLLLSAAGGVIFVMIPAAVITIIGVAISAVTYFIYKRYEKTGE